MNEMYNRIERLCKERGINITQMCREADIPRGNLTDLKMGRTAALSTKSLGKISSYFAVSMDYLLGNVTDPFFQLDNDRILQDINSYGDENEKAPIPEDERQKELDKLATEIKEQTRMMKTVVDSTYNFYLSLRELAKMDDPIPRYIAFNPKQESDIQLKIAALVDKFMKSATAQEKSDFLSELIEIEEEFRRKMENTAETPYPTPEEIEAYGEMAKNLAMQQFLSEEKPDAQASSAKESDVG